MKKMKKVTVERGMEPAEYLKRPYGRFIVPEDDGTFRAEIIEFPGCIATGDTAPEALANLEEVAAGWLAATLAKGQHIPEPVEGAGLFSGKLVVRLPKTLHRKATHAAAREGVSLNQFIVTSIAEQVGGSNTRQAPGRFVALPATAHVTANFFLSMSGFHPPTLDMLSGGSAQQYITVSSGAARRNASLMQSWERVHGGS